MDRFELVGTTASADPTEVAVLAAGISELPSAWSVQPVQLVRIPILGAAAEGFEAAAEAIGPNIRLGDSTFTTQGRASHRFELARVMAHELVHVDQYDALTAEYVDLLLGGQLGEVRLWEGSSLILDFAPRVGWENTADPDALPVWDLPAGERTATVYGRTNPAEDMAESVAMAVLGRGNLLDGTRQRWVENYLGTSMGDLADGKPYIPDGAITVEAPQPLYDQSAAQLAAGPFSFEEPMYFRLDASAPSVEILALEIGDQLTRRELIGALILDNSRQVPRYAGLFERRDGVSFWVELLDFRESPNLVTGPPSVVLSYVVFW